MIIKSVQPVNYGPFANCGALVLEDDVTVITGPNDVGKSFMLRALMLACNGKGGAIDERNQLRTRRVPGAWTEDPQVGCTITFEITEHSAGAHVARNLSVGDQVTVFRQLNKEGHAHTITDYKTKTSQSRELTFKLRKWPRVVTFPLHDEIRSAISLNDLNDSETQFIQLGFGKGFSPEAFINSDDIERHRRIDEAEQSLNDRLKLVLPSGMGYRLRLREISTGRLAIYLQDKHWCGTSLQARGKGVQRVLNVVGGMLLAKSVEEHTLLLYDEPETSLHADAQHTLRRALEEVADSPLVQVVYTTHSPAMVNSLRPHSVRVLARVTYEDSGTTTILDDGCDTTFSQVRSSLGVSPADSLLYGPITIITEGATEVLCLPQILQRLAEQDDELKAKLQSLLPLVHIVDGEGASFEYLVRLAESQGVKPIVFLDGDKENKSVNVRRKHPHVRVVVLDREDEFEDLVPLSAYIKAVSGLAYQKGLCSELEMGRFNEVNLHDWLHTHPVRGMTSKLVAKWLDIFDISLPKPEIMAEAIRIVDPKDIKREPLQEMIDAMSAIGASL